MAIARYCLVAYSNPVAGREDEFNAWYWNEHMKAILDIPGVVSGRRYTPAAAQFSKAPLPFQYLAIYEIEVDDPQKFINEMTSRAASGKMSRSTAITPDFSTVIWQLMSPP
jgi:hypothetical protein